MAITCEWAAYFACTVNEAVFGLSIVSPFQLDPVTNKGTTGAHVCFNEDCNNVGWLVSQTDAEVHFIWSNLVLPSSLFVYDSGVRLILCQDIIKLKIESYMTNWTSFHWINLRVCFSSFICWYIWREVDKGCNFKYSSLLTCFDASKQWS